MDNTLDVSHGLPPIEEIKKLELFNRKTLPFCLLRRALQLHLMNTIKPEDMSSSHYLMMIEKTLNFWSINGSYYFLVLRQISLQGVYELYEMFEPVTPTQSPYLKTKKR